METTKFWQGTNFWVTLSLLVAVGFTSFTEQTGETISLAVAGVFAGVFAVRQLVKDGKWDFTKFRTSVNTWNYLSQLVVLALGPELAQFVPLLRDLVDAALLKDYGKIISIVFNIGTLIYFLLQQKNREELSRIAGVPVQ
jgi:hypothetical protein